MENWSYYLILLLVGIIFGGYLAIRVVINFPLRTLHNTTHPAQTAVPPIAYQAANTINPLFFVVIITIFLVLYILANPHKRPKLNQSPKTTKTLLATNYTPSPTFDNKLHYETNLEPTSIPEVPIFPTFFIQLAAFKEKANALKLLADWQDQLAVSAQLMEEMNDPIPWKILIGPFASKAAATAYLEKQAIKGFVIHPN